MRRKHILLFSIVLVAFGKHSINAQLKIGISGGFNLNTISPQIADVTLDPFSTLYKTSESGTGFYSQVSSQANLNKYIDLLMLAGFSVHRYEQIERFDANGMHRHVNSIFTVNQINLGAVFLYGLPLGSGKASIGGGGNISYPISAKLNLTAVYINPGPGGTFVSEEDTAGQKFVPGALGMFRYEFNFGAIFEIRYNYQFQTMPGVNLSIFEIGAGYNLHFKRKKSKP